MEIDGYALITIKVGMIVGLAKYHQKSPKQGKPNIDGYVLLSLKVIRTDLKNKIISNQWLLEV